MYLNFKRTHYYVLCLGVLCGITAGVVVTLFRWLIQVNLLIIQKIYALSMTHFKFLFMMLMVNSLIGLEIGRLIHGQSGIKGSGIPQTEAEILGEKHYPWWSILWHKFIAGVLTVGSGAFMGHEGPSIQVGGAVGQGVAQLTHQNIRNSRLLIASGAAAGLTAVFNTPIASCLFVIETIYHRFSATAWIMLLSAAVTADLFSSSVFGRIPVLYIKKVPSLPLHLDLQLLPLGIAIGILGHLYKWITLNSFRPFAWISRRLHVSNSLEICFPLLLVVPIGVAYPQLIGSGINLIHLTGRSSLPFWLISVYLLSKFILSTIAFGSGLPGGILLPILTLGSLIGAAYGRLLFDYSWISPHYQVTFIIVAMAGFFACVIDAPFTAIILITEMVGTLHHLVALALIVLIACAVDNLFNGQPIYQVLLKRLMGPTDSFSKARS